VTAPPRTGVLGLGLVGGSLLQGLHAAGAEPIGFDADPDVTAAAAAAGCAVAADADSLAQACPVVIVCVPPARTPNAVAAALAAGAVVADAASVKAPVLAAVAEEVAEPELDRYVPAHPLAGSERAGWAAAEATLLADAVWAACPPRPRAPLDPLCALAAALEPLRPRLLICDAAEHDAAVARTSHAPHVAAMALARAPASGLGAALTGGAYRDMTRTAAADEALWAAILHANRGPVADALRALATELGELAGAIAAGDDAALAAAWRAGALARAQACALRWDEPAWAADRLGLPAWDALLAFGRAGRTIRRPRLDGDALAVEVAAGSA
jgi:prephenate dehydrogenase